MSVIGNPLLIGSTGSGSMSLITENENDAGGTTLEIIDGITAQSLTVTSNGTYTPSSGTAYTSVTVNVSSSGTDTSDATLTSGAQMLYPFTAYSKGSKYTGTIVSRTASDLTASGAIVTVPAGHYETQATKSIASGSATAPASISGTSASISAGTNTLTLTKTIPVTPSVSAGYVSAGTAGNSSVSLTASVTTKAATTITPSTSQQTAVAANVYTTGAVTVDVIPSQYIVPSGTKTITENGTGIDVTSYASVDVSVSGSSSVNTDTKTVTASNYPTSLSFSSMKGEPKAFVVRLNTSVSSSGNTTYYYIVEIAAFGSTTHGNCFRVGGTRQVTSVTSGYSWSYSGTTLTITSSAGSRSASPGAFYSGSYELLYVY